MTLYSIPGFEKLVRQETKKTVFANKDNPCNSLYVQLTVRIHLITIQQQGRFYLLR